MPKKCRSKPKQIEVICELRFLDCGNDSSIMSAKISDEIGLAIKDKINELYPEYKVRGCWVHWAAYVDHSEE